MRFPNPWPAIVGSTAAFALVPWLVMQAAWWTLPLVFVVLLGIYGQNLALWEAHEREADLTQQLYQTQRWLREEVDRRG